MWKDEADGRRSRKTYLLYFCHSIYYSFQCRRRRCLCCCCCFFPLCTRLLRVFFSYAFFVQLEFVIALTETPAVMECFWFFLLCFVRWLIVSVSCIGCVCAVVGDFDYAPTWKCTMSTLFLYLWNHKIPKTIQNHNSLDWILRQDVNIRHILYTDCRLYLYFSGINQIYAIKMNDPQIKPSNKPKVKEAKKNQRKHRWPKNTSIDTPKNVPNDIFDHFLRYIVNF